jgi:hypothetical protein
MKKVDTLIVVAVVAFLTSLLVPRSAGSHPTEQAVDTAAKYAGRTTEVCVTNSAGGTSVPSTGMTNRKAIELQNLGPNAIYCTVDGQAPLATGALGRKIDATSGTWALDIGRGIVVKCIAATAAQVTTACTQVTELR